MTWDLACSGAGRALLGASRWLLVVCWQWTFGVLMPWTFRRFPVSQWLLYLHIHAWFSFDLAHHLSNSTSAAAPPHSASNVPFLGRNWRNPIFRMVGHGCKPPGLRPGQTVRHDHEQSSRILGFRRVLLLSISSSIIFTFPSYPIHQPFSNSPWPSLSLCSPPQWTSPSPESCQRISFGPPKALFPFEPAWGQPTACFELEVTKLWVLLMKYCFSSSCSWSDWRLIRLLRCPLLSSFSQTNCKLMLFPSLCW